MTSLCHPLANYTTTIVAGGAMVLFSWLLVSSEVPKGLMGSWVCPYSSRIALLEQGTLLMLFMQDGERNYAASYSTPTVCLGLRARVTLFVARHLDQVSLVARASPKSSFRCCFRFGFCC